MYSEEMKDFHRVAMQNSIWACPKCSAGYEDGAGLVVIETDCEDDACGMIHKSDFCECLKWL